MAIAGLGFTNKAFSMPDFELQVTTHRRPPVEQLAGQIAAIASTPTPVAAELSEIVASRLIDSAACAVAALNRKPVIAARASAVARPVETGAAVFGINPSQRFDLRKTAIANSVAIRDLDYNDSFFALDTAHPSDSIAAILAVAQMCECDGAALTRGILTAYEIQIALVSGIPLMRYNLDQSTHLAPSIAAGIAATLGLDVDVAFNAISQAAHCALTTRQGRTGNQSSWKSYVPGFASVVAFDAIDRALQGERSPDMVYEGPQGLTATVLGGDDSLFQIRLPDAGSELRAITTTYPKEHATGYASQALIDLAFRMRQRVNDLAEIKSIRIHTSAHHHNVHGSGALDEDNMSPDASRESLDHSMMYAFVVALEDGVFHHDKSFTHERANRARTRKLWRNTRSCVDTGWDDAYENAVSPLHKAQGGRVEITLADGASVVDELRYPHAHPLGERPFTVADATNKFHSVAADLVEAQEQERLMSLAARLTNLTANEVAEIGVSAKGLIEASASQLTL